MPKEGVEIIKGGMKLNIPKIPEGVIFKYYIHAATIAGVRQTPELEENVKNGLKELYETDPCKAWKEVQDKYIVNAGRSGIYSTTAIKEFREFVGQQYPDKGVMEIEHKILKEIDKAIQIAEDREKGGGRY